MNANGLAGDKLEKVGLIVNHFTKHKHSEISAGELTGAQPGAQGQRRRARRQTMR